MADLDPLDQAKQFGYVRSKDADTRRQWHQWCKMHDQPCLQVEDRAIYATVSLDTITCEQRVLTREGVSRIRLVLYRYADGGDVRGGTPNPHPGSFIWSERIPRDRAEYVAGCIASIVNEEMVEWHGSDTAADYVPASTVGEG